MHLERIPERLTEQVEKVRDRTAEAVGSDGGSVLRELGKLTSHLDEVKDELGSRIDGLSGALTDTGERIGDLEIETKASTTWPRRLFWLVVGAAAGMVAAYLADPDRGEQRRTEISDQAATRAREVKEELATRAKDVKEQAVASAERVRGEAERGAQDVAEEAQHAATDVRDQVVTSSERVVDDVTSDTRA